jgi:hypothetical protein
MSFMAFFSPKSRKTVKWLRRTPLQADEASKAPPLFTYIS